MAEYTHDEQVEIVRKALSLETAIKVEQANVELIKSQEFDRFPSYAEAFPDRPPMIPAVAPRPTSSLSR